MKKLACGLGLFLLSLTGVQAQTSYKVVTRPTVPAREALARMSLVQAWHTRLPIHGQRDGLYSVQILPAEPWPQIVVQTHGGVVALLDGETGDILWSSQIYSTGPVTQATGANSHSIFVIRVSDLHVINRRTGYQRVYSIGRVTKLVTYGMPLLELPSAAAAADEDAVYFSMSNRLVAYALPTFEPRPVKVEAPPEKTEAAEGDQPKEEAPIKPPPAPPRPGPAAPEPLRPVKESLQPKFDWGYTIAGDTIQQPPLITGAQAAAVTANGEVLVLNKFSGKYILDYRITSHITRTSGQHGNTVYVAADDAYIYAINLETGTLLWRHLAGAMLAVRPNITDLDVFAAPGREGLVRLQRDTGREVWRNRQVERFLAVNQKFVYAADRLGNFYVLDGLRGTSLSKIDMQDWNMPLPNEWNDRIYFAGRDGQILCLRYRENSAPVPMKTLKAGRKIEAKGPPEEKKPAEPMKGDEKKVEEKKEEKKALKKEEKKEEDKKEDEKKEKEAALHLHDDVGWTFLSGRSWSDRDIQPTIGERPRQVALSRRRLAWSAP
jgi:outer membrane protein assembly factor BamB